jgi:predicted oxidoreductase (fatty acid repression mutant protein)
VLLLKGKHLANVVVVRVSVYTLKQSLTNKVKRVRAAVEALVGRVKTYLLSNCSNRAVVIRRVVKHKVTNSVS